MLRASTVAFFLFSSYYFNMYKRKEREHAENSG
jgi:hypothetical protein